MRCLDIAFERQGQMIDPTQHEVDALLAASGPAGEYIESLVESGAGTDMAKWSEKVWYTFLETVVTAYTDELRRLSVNQQSAVLRMAEIPPAR
jgi:hypothetical protein